MSAPFWIGKNFAKKVRSRRCECRSGARGPVQACRRRSGAGGRTDRSPSRGTRESNAILSGGGAKKPAPCSFHGEQKESRFSAYPCCAVGSHGGLWIVAQQEP